MKRFGILGGTLILAALIIAVPFYVPSCQLSPEQQQRMQSIAVPVASILSTAAVQRGWIEPGDKVLIQRGVAVVTSPDSPEVKLYKLAEVGLEESLKRGLVSEGDEILLQSPATAVITSPPPPPAEVLPNAPPSGPLNPLLPPAQPK